jgi:16S rRNA (guanine527-N7)-methyltransferase
VRSNRKWTKAINIAPSSVPDIWDRHIVDSAGFSLCSRRLDVLDNLATDGGLPALVVTILDQQKRPMTLKRQTQNAFLATARRLGF